MGCCCSTATVGHAEHDAPNAGKVPAASDIPLTRQKPNQASLGLPPKAVDSGAGLATLQDGGAANQRERAIAKTSLEDDPHWDRAGFESYARHAKFLPIGYLRKLHNNGQRLQGVGSQFPCCDVPCGAPRHEDVTGQQLFAVMTPSFGLDIAPDLSGELAAIVHEIDSPSSGSPASDT